jgi:hypothetical protein
MRLGQVITVDRDPVRDTCGWNQVGHTVERRKKTAFATTGWTNDRRDTALSDSQRGIADRRERAVMDAESFGANHDWQGQTVFGQTLASRQLAACCLQYGTAPSSPPMVALAGDSGIPQLSHSVSEKNKMPTRKVRFGSPSLLHDVHRTGYVLNV